MTTHRPFFITVLAFTAGVLLSRWTHFSVYWLFIFIIVFAIFSAMSAHKKIISLVMLFFTFVLLGNMYTTVYESLAEDHIVFSARYYRKKQIEMKGKIISDVEKRNFFKTTKTVFTLDIYQIKTNWGWKKRSGKVLVNIFKDEELFFGDVILIHGKLHKPFNFGSRGNFSYCDFLRNRGIYYLLSVKKTAKVDVMKRNQGFWLRGLSLKFKNKLSRRLSEHLTKNEAGLMKAIILGERHDIAKHIRQLFVETGTAHILAISGLHIGIVAFLFFVFVKLLPLPLRIQYLLIIILLIFYAFMTGARPSVVRATIMAVLFLSSLMMEKETEGINTLSIAAFVLLLMNPFNVFDLGFQLSFVSVFSILMICPRLYEIFSKWQVFKKNRIIRWSLHSLNVSLAASLGVSGLILYYFHIVTPVDLLANLFVVPMIAVVVALGMGLLLTTFLWPSLAVLFAVCLKVVLNFMVAGIFLIGQIPGAYFYIDNVTHWHLIGYYICLSVLLITFFLSRRRLTNFA